MSNSQKEITPLDIDKMIASMEAISDLRRDMTNFKAQMVHGIARIDQIERNADIEFASIWKTVAARVTGFKNDIRDLQREMSREDQGLDPWNSNDQINENEESQTELGLIRETFGDTATKLDNDQNEEVSKLP